MRRYWFLLLGFLVSTLMTHLPIEARAEFSLDSGSLTDFYLGGSVLYYSDLRQRTSRDEKANFNYDGRAGYQVYPNIYLGALYAAEQASVKTSGYSSDSLNNSSKSNRASWGPSLGFFTTSLHLNFIYFIESKWRLETTTSTGSGSYAYSGTGFQAEIGYKFPLWGMLIGPQVAYKKFTYDKLSTDNGSSLSISPKLEEDTFEPALVVLFFF